MSKPEEARLIDELRSAGLYKRNQGRLTRQLTAGTIIVVALVGAYILSRVVLNESNAAVRLGLPTVFAVAASWFAFRIVNYPRFAEFLIAVEGEMARVSWPGKTEVTRATTVVIGTMALLTFVLFVFDWFWAWLMSVSLG